MNKVSITVLILLMSCSWHQKNESPTDSLQSKNNANQQQSPDSTKSIKSKLTKEELEYIKKRDGYTERLQSGQRQSKNYDSLSRADNTALLQLQHLLKQILKGSRLSGKGKINLETLLNYPSFGLLDGLRVDAEDDTTLVVYTTKNLLFDGMNETQFDKLCPSCFAGIFQEAFLGGEAGLEDFYFIKLDSTKDRKTFGLAAAGYQAIMPITPDCVGVLVSVDDYVYIGLRYLHERLKEIPKCQSVWDSLVSAQTHSGELSMDEFELYCNCYRKELKNGNQLAAIQKQMQLIENDLYRELGIKK